jgi:hypothetical protein
MPPQMVAAATISVQAIFHWLAARVHRTCTNASDSTRELSIETFKSYLSTAMNAAHSDVDGS